MTVLFDDFKLVARRIARAPRPAPRALPLPLNKFPLVVHNCLLHSLPHPHLQIPEIKDKMRKLFHAQGKKLVMLSVIDSYVYM